jgi:hypothetical protein
VDRVADFTSGEDALWIKASLFGLEPGPVAQQQFGLGRAASGDQFVMFDPETGGLWIDRDGTGPLPERLTFILLGDTSPEASDILFY